MDFLTSAILSGAIFDIIKTGTKIQFDSLKTALAGWLVSDEQIQKILDGLKEAGIDEDLNQPAIERRISESESLTSEISSIHRSSVISQTTSTGHNINSTNSTITIGDLNVNSEK